MIKIFSSHLKQLAVFYFILSILVAPSLVFAIGQVTSPIVIDNALRSGEYQERMIIVNNEKEKAEVKLSAEGQTASWTKFYLLSDLKTPIQTLTMEKGTNLTLAVVFSVPADAANGEYKGYIGAGKKAGSIAGSESGSSVSVEQKINREVTIKVTDKEEINLLVSVIPESYDVRTGKNLSVRFIYDNQSNVALRPQISFRIKNSSKIFYESIFPYPSDEDSVRALAQHEIPALNIATSDLASGKYIAEMEFLHNGQSIAAKSFKFNVGSGSVLGAMDINLSGLWPVAGLALILAAAFLAMALIVRKVIKNKKDTVL